MILIDYIPVALAVLGIVGRVAMFLPRPPKGP
jgi:hypothetical protein